MHGSAWHACAGTKSLQPLLPRQRTQGKFHVVQEGLRTLPEVVAAHMCAQGPRRPEHTACSVQSLQTLCER